MRAPRLTLAALAVATMVSVTTGTPAHGRPVRTRVVPSAPVVAWAEAGRTSGDARFRSQVMMYISGPAGATAEVRAWTSLDDPCSKATEGTGVVELPTRTVTTSGGAPNVIVTYTPLTAGWFVYATTTVDGETSAVSDCAPVRPGKASHITLVDVTRTSATFTWDAAPGATNYQIEMRTRRSTGPTVITPDDSSTFTVTGLDPGSWYEANFGALHDDIPGSFVTYGRRVVPPFGTEVDLARRQYPDFYGRPPKDSELFSFSSGHVAGKTTATMIDEIVDNPYWGAVQGPMVRLMTAYYQRVPDRGGLTYWTNQLRKGRSLRALSSALAASPEFERRYGSLTNAQFVDRVYRNVLGRPADRSGLAYWTRRLDTSAISRGGVMVSFSESSENIRKMKAYVDTIDVFTAMVRRVPTSAELATWASESGTAPTRRALIFLIIASAEYDARLPAPAGPP